MKKTKFIIVTLITIISVVLMMMAGFTACPQTTTTEETTTTITTLYNPNATDMGLSSLSLRGNFTNWKVTNDSKLYLSKYSDGTYRITIDMSEDLGFTDRPRFKIVNQSVGSDWSDAQTINGFDPAAPASDPESDLLAEYSPATMYKTTQGKKALICKIKGGRNNITLFRGSAKFTLILSKLKFLGDPTVDIDLGSTDPDEYVYLITNVEREGTVLHPTDRITANKGIRLGGKFNGWDESEPLWTISGNTASKTYNIEGTTDPAGETYGFGILNPTWGWKWCGVNFTTTDIANKTVKELQPGALSNCNVTIDTTADYKFTVDFTDIFKPTLKIEKL